MSHLFLQHLVSAVSAKKSLQSLGDAGSAESSAAQHPPPPTATTNPARPCTAAAGEGRRTATNGMPCSSGVEPQSEREQSLHLLWHWTRGHRAAAMLGRVRDDC